jgi:hypothetical protein
MFVKPKVDRATQRIGIERVELGPARPFDPHKSGFFQHIEMLRYRLSGERYSVLRKGKGTNFEQGLTRPLAQAVYDPAAGRVTKCFEDAVEFVVVHEREYAIKLLHVKEPSIRGTAPCWMAPS